VSRELFFNGDFDLTLRGKPSVFDGEDLTYVHEMAMHFLFAGEAEDTLVVHRPLPEDFLEYLGTKRLKTPSLKLHPAYSPDAEFTPFGWNEYAARRNALYRRPAAHPPLEAVRRANSRVFSQALERELDGPDAGGLFETLGALETHLRKVENPSGWVVKGNHGHAGTANVRLFGALPGEDERKAIAVLFEESGSVALEPWHERVSDLAVNFQVDAQGVTSALRGHELLNSRDGAFLGVKLTPSGQAPEPWRAALEERAALVGKALAGIGYFGPVGMDAYAWTAGPKGAVLRPMADINARLSMALPAHGLARRLPGKYLLWEWVKPKKLTLPATYAELRARLGRSDFDPGTGEGILATSPFWVTPRLRSGDQGRLRPRRMGFLFSAGSEAELTLLRRDFPLRRREA
jgi:hypothetical protein